MARPLKEPNKPRKTNSYSLKIINHEMIKTIAKNLAISNSEALDAMLDEYRKAQQ